MSLLIIKTKTNKVILHGVDQPEADLVAYENGILVIKVPGHRYQYGYSSVDTVSYAPAEYQLYKPTSVTVHHTASEILVQADRLLTFPVRIPKTNENEVTCVDLALKNLYNHATLQLGERLKYKGVFES